MEDQNWRIVIGFPAFLNIITIILILLFYKNPSIIALLEKDDAENDKIAIEELKKIYILKEPMTYEKLLQ